MIRRHYHVMLASLTMLAMMHTLKRFLPSFPHLRGALLGGLLAFGMSACVYRAPVQQGNFLENKDIDQVTVGMTQAQVRYALGTPMIIDPFTKDRWDYVYYLKQSRTAQTEQRHFVVYFENGNVTRIERPAVPKA
jgi:outer membrane protein assembly factor BamE